MQAGLLGLAATWAAMQDGAELAAGQLPGSWLVSVGSCLGSPAGRTELS